MLLGIIKVEIFKVAATQKTREQFIELRAENINFDKIAKQLKVSKSSLILWSKIYELDIQNLRAITDESLNQRYKASQEHRLQMWSEHLESVREELKGQKVVKPFDAELLTPTKQVTWNG